MLEVDAERAAQHLAGGVERCPPGTGTRIVLWTMIVDAVDMVERLDDKERRWLSSGFRSNGWHAVVNRLIDRREMERHRIHSGISIAEGQPYYAPQGQSVERTLWVLSWLSWVHADPRRGPDLVKAAVLLAKGREQHAAELMPRTRSRQVSYEIKNRVSDHVRRGLKREYGIDADAFVAARAAICF